MLVGLLSPTAGEATVAGVAVAGAPLHVKRRIGYMAQTFSLYPDLTVSENIQLYAGVYGLSGRETRRRRAWVSELAGLAGLQDELPKSLPMGTRQRLSLGCALVHQPQVLFLDEPTSGVDPLGRRQFWEIIVRIARLHRVAVLVTTHYMSEAEHCDRLALMHQGRIIASGSPLQMRRGIERDVGAPLLISAPQPLSALHALREAGFRGATLQGRRVRLLSPKAEEDEQRIRQLLADRGVQDASIERAAVTMQDVFVCRVLSHEQADRPREDRQE
jgi:ABC-2 type transport system ATP-binding protein